LAKHLKKAHFVPIKYRVLGGFLQFLNIKFGNFIEVLMDKVISTLTEAWKRERKNFLLSRENFHDEELDIVAVDEA
jgi:hypothetical protein